MFGGKFGFDSLIGILPIAGDVMTGVAGLYAFYTAHRLNLSTGAKLKILWNILFDVVIGLIPIVGDVIDFFFPAHAKNFRLIEKHLAKRMQDMKQTGEPAETP